MTISTKIGIAKVHVRRCVTMKCSHCGSENVVRDAYAEWDKIKQAWVVKAVFDATECFDCGCERKLVEEDI